MLAYILTYIHTEVRSTFFSYTTFFFHTSGCESHGCLLCAGFDVLGSWKGALSIVFLQVACRIWAVHYTHAHTHTHNKRTHSVGRSSSLQLHIHTHTHTHGKRTHSVGRSSSLQLHTHHTQYTLVGLFWHCSRSLSGLQLHTHTHTHSHTHTHTHTVREHILFGGVLACNYTHTHTHTLPTSSRVVRAPLDCLVLV
jgi:hypothetical protein